jgi:uncharacterized protein (TIGR02246 family)
VTSTTVGVHGQLAHFYERWNAAFDAKDVRAFVDLYTEDARLMPPGSPALVGRDAISAYIETSFFAAGVEGSEMQSAAVEDTGAFIIDIGTYVITFAGGIQAAGNYVTMFSRGPDDGLQARYDIFSPSVLPQ